MLRGVSQTLKLSASMQRRLLSQTARGSLRVHRVPRQHYFWIAGSAALTGATILYATRDAIHNDASENAPGSSASVKAAEQETAVRGVSPVDGSLATLVWGSNRCVSKRLKCDDMLTVDVGHTYSLPTTRYPNTSALRRLQTGLKTSPLGISRYMSVMPLA